MEEFGKHFFNAAEYITLRYFIIAGFAYILFYFILKKSLASKKIQQQFPKYSKIIAEILYSIQTMLIFAVIATLVLVTFRDYTLLYFNIDDFGWIYYIASFPLMFIIHDTYFYWMHRAMHLPVIFKRVHLVHHKSTNPTPFTSYSFHFIESIFEALIIPIIAFLFPVHFSALILFLLLQFIYNVYGHLGWELYSEKFTKGKIGRWINTSYAHNLHHKHFDGNYGLYFLFWDRKMGTLRSEYDDGVSKRVK